MCLYSTFQDTLRVFVHGSFTSMLLVWPSTFVVESSCWIWWLIPFCRGQNKKQAVTALQYTSCNSHRIHSTACQWPSQRRHWLGLYYKRPRQTGSWSPLPPKICINRSFLQQEHENKYNIWHLISSLSWVYHLSQIAYPSSDTPGAGKSEAARKMPLLVPPWEGDSSMSEPHWRHLDLGTEVPEITAKLSEAILSWLKRSKWPAIEGNPPENFRSWSRHTKSPCSCCHYAAPDWGLSWWWSGSPAAWLRSGRMQWTQWKMSSWHFLKATTQLRWEGLSFPMLMLEWHHYKKNVRFYFAGRCLHLLKAHSGVHCAYWKALKTLSTHP